MRAATAVATALGLLAAPPESGGEAPRGPIRVGVLLPTTGVFAANGKDFQNGVLLFFEERRNRLAGRDVSLAFEDTQAVPATGLAKTRSLVEAQGVHLVVGPLNAAVGYAIAPYLTEKRIPAIFPIVSSEDITQRKRSPYIVRTGWASAQPSQPFGKWVYEHLGYRRIATIGYDFSFGWEVVGGFHRTFEEAGGRIVQKLWTPTGTTDFGPYLAQLRRDVDAVFAQFSGADAMRFTRQFADAGLKGRVPLIGGGTLTDEHVLRTMGDEVLGVVTPLHYSAALDTPANARFVRSYQARFGQVPSYYSDGGYVAGLVLEAALQATGGEVEDRERLLAAIRKVDLPDAPRGPMRIDAYGNPVENIYVRRVERVDGRLQNTVVFTFPAVSQFWTYDPAAFLANPVYGRDFPACGNCGK